MNVALYLRVSTLDQNPEAQRRELEAYAARHGWDVTAQYEDIASGSDRKRPELARLLEDCRRGKVECVLVWKLDRFGRSAIDLYHNLQLLDSEAVRFIATSQGIDTERSNPVSRFLLHVLGAVAELERDQMRERTVSGMRRYQADLAANKVGRTVHSQSGKDLPPHRPKRIFDLNEAKAMRAAGFSYAFIGESLSLCPSTVYRRLKEVGTIK